MSSWLTRLIGGSPEISRRDNSPGSSPHTSLPPGAAALALQSEPRAIHIVRDKARLRLENGRIVITTPDEPDRRLRPQDLAQVSLYGTAEISAPCLHMLMREGVPVVWRSHGGHYMGQSADLSGNISRIRRAQYKAADNPQRALNVARALVNAKLMNANRLLREKLSGRSEAPPRLARLAKQAFSASSLDELRGIEGAGAAAYFAAFPAAIRSPAECFVFAGRNRRPPCDPMNALLSYLYAVLTGNMAASALAAGLDPYVGFLHSERPGRSALALDLMEPFRPALADRVALALINRGTLTPDSFITRPDSSVRLSDMGRRSVLSALEARLDRRIGEALADGGALTWRMALLRQSERLTAHLTGASASFPQFIQR